MKKLKHKLIISALLFFAATSMRSQNTAKPEVKPEYKVNLVDNKEVVIEFDTDKILDNVLILIVDAAGNTLFVDNQKDFKGIYKCSVDMSMYAKGNYFVNIKSEGEQKQAKLTIR